MIRAKIGFHHRGVKYNRNQIIETPDEKTLVASGLAYYAFANENFNKLKTQQAEYWQKAKGCCND